MYISKKPPKEKVKTIPMEQEWKDRLVKSMWWQDDNICAYDPDEPWAQRDIDSYIELHKRLLEIGGEETCFSYPEEDMENILERGQVYIGQSKMMVGQPCGCHRNSYRLWERNHGDKDVHIITGYALTDDGMWRQHSALIHRYVTPSGQKRAHIIETTVKRLAYFAYELTDEEAEAFGEAVCY